MEHVTLSELQRRKLEQARPAMAQIPVVTLVVRAKHSQSTLNEQGVGFELQFDGVHVAAVVLAGATRLKEKET
ncbi:unnamed protein product [Didymodactylos carnosus]|uniref:Uncharacterized protein n=1 Tax=Didymodactylos carnosus TaxID=1234261 RepID=A0A814Q9Y2_9BILA|nr:unnamed protein product [Didymodactylos carnosus]CAF1291500.1 unnamed protein product [Didymodactylos carnosus]CAF3880187.1 unnamed protein product [Didymodactylos carnosus]CAF4096273.1 unnamed protein product [Didymodactylos carnosus]